MNVFNRGVVGLTGLVLIGAAAAVIALAWAAPQDTIGALRDAVDWLDDNNDDLEKVVLTSGAVIVGLLGLMLLLFELLPHAGSDVRVTDVEGGDAVLTTVAIGQRIEEAVRDVANVSLIRASVQAKRKGVIVYLDLHVEPQASLAVVADEASQATRRVLAEKVHVALLAPPRVRLHYRELRLQRAVHARSPAPVSPAPPPRRVGLPPPDETTEAMLVAKEEETAALSESAEPEAEAHEPASAKEEERGEA